MKINPFHFAPLFIVILFIGIRNYQERINDKIKNEIRTTKKLIWSKNVVSLTRDSVFTIGLADYYYRDLIIPTNKKLEYFNISSDVDVTKIIKKDTLPTIKKYTTTIYKHSQFLFFQKKWELYQTNISFVLTIPKNSYIKTITKEKELDSIRLVSNIIEE